MSFVRGVKGPEKSEAKREGGGKERENAGERERDTPLFSPIDRVRAC